MVQQTFRRKKKSSIIEEFRDLNDIAVCKNVDLLCISLWVNPYLIELSEYGFLYLASAIY